MSERTAGPARYDEFPATRIAVLGCGNMGYALLHGLLHGGCPPQLLRGAEPDAARRERVQRLEIETAAGGREAVRDAQVVILAVKPAQVPALTAEISGLLAPGTMLLSLAAGVRLQTLQAALAPGTPVVRAMPNTPALIGAGVTGLTAGEHAGAAQRRLAESILSSVGTVLWVEPESLLDAVTALSGSGPAYFFYFLECLEAAAAELGLPIAQARLLARRTAAGAAAMSLREEATDLAELRRAVTSPGGTTEAALHQFQDAGLAEITRRVLRAACRRARELSEPSSA